MVTLSEPDLAPAHLHRALSQGLTQAQATGMPVVVSVSAAIPRVDPLDVFAAAGTVTAERVYWERPAHGIALAGAGVAYRVEASAARAALAWREMLGRSVVEETSGPLAGPLLIGGFAFDPRAQPAASASQPAPLWRGFPAGQLTLPRVTVATSDHGSTVTLNALLTPGGDVDGTANRLLSDYDGMLHAGTAQARDAASPSSTICERFELRDTPSRAQWEALVAAAAEACDNGYVEKVVLARAVQAHGSRRVDPSRVLVRLRRSYPSAYVFAVAHGERCFLGATPERLARLRSGVADVACLAGSAPRGGSTEEDAYLGGALLASAKDRAEHAIVVREVLSRLAATCSDLKVPAAPRLLRLQNVQHLYTPVEARVQPGLGILDLVERLHPTSAVGGYPRQEALRYIRTHEGLDRGWYAGPVGWVNHCGDGEFAVALRSALLDGSAATLFAGCGIVAASRPADEYAETCLKLRPMLTALNGCGDGA